MSGISYADMEVLMLWLSSPKYPATPLSKNLHVSIIGSDRNDNKDAFDFLLEDLSHLWKGGKGIRLSLIQHYLPVDGKEVHHLNDIYTYSIVP